jgi:two-component system, OmpR family, response regulator
MKRMRILFVSGKALVEQLQPALVADGIVVEMAEQPDKADFKILGFEYDAILLDRTAFHNRSFSALLRWRQAGLKSHILVLLSGDSTSAERADCLDAGADAYLLAPLSSEELGAHLRALRRREYQTFTPIRKVHDLEINTSVRTVKRGDRLIHLTPREFELLSLLAYHQGQVVTRTMIREHLYNDGSRETYHSNVVDVYVRYLRNKIDKGFGTPLILTRWGEGYLLRAENV